MSYSKVVFSGAVIVTGSAFANERTVAVKDLGLLGISQINVTTGFKNNVGINLNPHEILRVTKDEEGKNIHFETLDHHSIRVDIKRATGSFNKISL